MNKNCPEDNINLFVGEIIDGARIETTSSMEPKSNQHQ